MVELVLGGQVTDLKAFFCNKKSSTDHTDHFTPGSCLNTRGKGVWTLFEKLALGRIAVAHPLLAEEQGSLWPTTFVAKDFDASVLRLSSAAQDAIRQYKTNGNIDTAMASGATSGCPLMTELRGFVIDCQAKGDSATHGMIPSGDFPLNGKYYDCTTDLARRNSGETQ